MMKCRECGKVCASYDGVMWHFEQQHPEKYREIKRWLKLVTEEISYLEALTKEQLAPQESALRQGWGVGQVSVAE